MAARTMNSCVFTAQHKVQWMQKPLPQIKRPTDMIVKMHKTTICGTDLHIRSGNVSTAAHGRILGHEGVGIVVQKGQDVNKFKEGDKVLISCISGCGHCSNCKKGFYAHCEAEDGGWVLGNTIDGCQSEYVRIPHGNGPTVHHIPKGVSEEAAILCSDILPTSLEVGLQDAQVKEGDRVCVVGLGPVGLSAVLNAKLFKPSEIIAIDINPHRLETAKRLGATTVINNADGKAADLLLERTNGKGIDAVIECVGNPAAWYLCEKVVRAGGRIALLGVHGKSVTLHLEEMWKRNFSLTAGLVCTNTIPLLLDRIADGTLDPLPIFTHRFELQQMDNAYECFTKAEQYRSVKMLIANKDSNDGFNPGPHAADAVPFY